jgi:orotidine-5'-phosphate decarboxylase
MSRGASMLVVGRPITQADDPAQAAAAILQQMNPAD